MGTFQKVICPVYATVHSCAGPDNFDKVPETHSHVSGQWSAGHPAQGTRSQTVISENLKWSSKCVNCTPCTAVQPYYPARNLSPKQLLPEPICTLHAAQQVLSTGCERYSETFFFRLIQIKPNINTEF